MADQTLSYAIRLDTSGFSSGLSQAAKSLSAFRIGLANALVSKGFSLLQQAANRFAAAFRSSLDLGSELTHLSSETGVSVSNLLVLRQAFEDCGAPAGTLSTAIAMMNKALSGISETGQRTEKVFASLGLDLGQLRQMAPADAFSAIAGAVGSLQSPAERTAAAIAIFGRSGASLNRVFANPDAIKQARDALGSMPSIMTTLSGTAESWQTSLGRVQTQIQGAVMGSMSSLLPVLDEIGKKMSSLDLTKLGVKIGAYLKQLWEDGLMGLFNQLAARCNIIGVAVWEALKMAFAPLSSGSTWKAIGLLASGAFIEAGAVLLKGVAAANAVLQAGVMKAIDLIKEGLNYLPFADFDTSGAKSFGEHYNDSMQRSSRFYQPGLDMGADLWDRGIKGAADAWKGAFDDWGDKVMNSAGAQYLDAFNQQVQAAVEGTLQQAAYAEKDAAKAFQPSGEPREIGYDGNDGNNGNSLGKAGRAAGQPAADQWARIGAFAGNGTQAETLNIQRSSLTALKALQSYTQKIADRMNRAAAATTL